MPSTGTGSTSRHSRGHSNWRIATWTFPSRSALRPPTLLSWTGRLDEAQGQYQVLRQRCLERGAQSDVMFVAVHSALVDIWRGRYSDSARAARDAVERAEQMGGDHLLVIAKTMRGAA